VDALPAIEKSGKAARLIIDGVFGPRRLPALLSEISRCLLAVDVRIELAREHDRTLFPSCRSA